MRILCGNLNEFDVGNIVLSKTANEINHIFSCGLIVIWMWIPIYFQYPQKRQVGV